MLNGKTHAFTDMANKLAAGEFGGLPLVLLLPSDDINVVMGDQSRSTGIVYLYVDALAVTSTEQVIALLTEALKHHLDEILNALDNLGMKGRNLKPN